MLQLQFTRVLKLLQLLFFRKESMGNQGVWEIVAPLTLFTFALPQMYANLRQARSAWIETSLPSRGWQTALHL